MRPQSQLRLNILSLPVVVGRVEIFGLEDAAVAVELVALEQVHVLALPKELHTPLPLVLEGRLSAQTPEVAAILCFPQLLQQAVVVALGALAVAAQGVQILEALEVVPVLVIVAQQEQETRHQQALRKAIMEVVLSTHRHLGVVAAVVRVPLEAMVVMELAMVALEPPLRFLVRPCFMQAVVVAAPVAAEEQLRVELAAVEMAARVVAMEQLIEGAVVVATAKASPVQAGLAL